MENRVLPLSFRGRDSRRFPRPPSTVRYIIHAEIRAKAARALAWVTSFLGKYDTTMVAWVRIDLGREYKDRLGRTYRKYRGVYGRCWYPTEENPFIRISCQVPGPFPCDIVTRKLNIYRNPDGSWPAGFAPGRRTIVRCKKTGRSWVPILGKTTVHNLDEAVVWIIAHEAFHWLRKTRQIPGRNTEIEADAFADRMFEAFRTAPTPTPPPKPAVGQLTLWDMADLERKV